MSPSSIAAAKTRPYGQGWTMGQSPWLTMAAGAVHVACPTAEAFRKLARRNGIPIYRIGRKLLVDRRDLDAWIVGHRAS